MEFEWNRGWNLSTVSCFIFKDILALAYVLGIFYSKAMECFAFYFFILLTFRILLFKIMCFLRKIRKKVEFYYPELTLSVDFKNMHVYLFTCMYVCMYVFIEKKC